MSTTEFNILFKMIENLVAVQATQATSSGSILKLVESVLEHCIDACKGKCGESHGV